tara:strand:+ start:459 stop:1664 length:1206 start_codon:yes stop_codon:yes gene_type:complete
VTEYADGSAALASRREFDRLTAETTGQTCYRCHSRVWVAWKDGAWKVRCLEGFNPDPVKTKLQLARREGMTIQRYSSELPEMMNQGGAIGTMPEQRPMTIEEFDQRQGLIKHVVSQMEVGVHYGVIPGTHDNSLWEPGAEYLRAAFNIQWGYELVEQREDSSTHDYYYQFFAFQQLGPGVRGPGWDASAWSKERKFFCRGGRDGCPKDCPQTHQPSMEAQMLPHNVRDRALKRAFVAMIRNVTGTTGYFKQALDNEPDDFDVDIPQGDGTDHPWLAACPEHKQAWFQSKKMREPAHKQGAGWCNQSVVLKPLLDDELKKLTADSWEPKDVTTYLKENFGGTWSQLSPKRKLDALDTLNTTAPPSAQAPPSTGEEPPQDDVDPETGEIQPTMMDVETPPLLH